jgi:hypothetical protein
MLVWPIVQRPLGGGDAIADGQAKMYKILSSFDPDADRASGKSRFLTSVAASHFLEELIRRHSAMEALRDPLLAVTDALRTADSQLWTAPVPGVLDARAYADGRVPLRLARRITCLRSPTCAWANVVAACVLRRQRVQF